MQGMQGEHRSAAGSGDSGATRVPPLRNVIAAGHSGVASSGVAQPGLGVSVSQHTADHQLSSALSELQSQFRILVGNMHGEGMVSSGS